MLLVCNNVVLMLVCNNDVMVESLEHSFVVSSNTFEHYNVAVSLNGGKVVQVGVSLLRVFGEVIEAVGVSRA